MPGQRGDASTQVQPKGGTAQGYSYTQGLRVKKWASLAHGVGRGVWPEGTQACSQVGG